jgi:hypothetical protein
MISRPVRYLAAAAIFTAGACTTAMNWRFSYQLGTTEWDSTIWAIFSVALDVTKWLMLPYAALAGTRRKMRALSAITIWFVATTYSFTAAMGFAALNRDTTTSERAQQVELQKTIETMKQSPRWQSSAACADATAPQSKQFCATYAAAEARLKLTSRDPDPQSALIAKLTGLSIETVRPSLSVFLAVACEVISALGFFAILQNDSPTTARPKPAPTPWTPPLWPAQVPSRPDTSWRDGPRHVATEQCFPLQSTGKCLRLQRTSQSCLIAEHG